MKYTAHFHLKDAYFIRTRLHLRMSSASSFDDISIPASSLAQTALPTSRHDSVASSIYSTPPKLELSSSSPAAAHTIDFSAKFWGCPLLAAFPVFASLPELELTSSSLAASRTIDFSGCLPGRTVFQWLSPANSKESAFLSQPLPISMPTSAVFNEFPDPVFAALHGRFELLGAEAPFNWLDGTRADD